MAFNEDTSFIEYNVEQPTQDFVTNFDTIGGTTDVVLVTVDGVLTDTPESSYTVQQINHTTWRITPEVQTGSVVRLYRVTDIDEMMHVFTAGAKFIARNMDSNFKQIRHAQQEVRDGFSKLATDTYAVIDGLDAALELAQDAAQDAQDAAIIAQDAADTVNAIIVGGKVAADKVLDESGKDQQEINNIIRGTRLWVEQFANGDDLKIDAGPAFRRAIAYAKDNGFDTVWFRGNYKITSIESEKWTMPKDDGSLPASLIPSDAHGVLPAEASTEMDVHLIVPSGIGIKAENERYNSLSFDWSRTTGAINTSQKIGILQTCIDFDGTYVPSVGCKNRYTRFAQGNFGGFTLQSAFIGFVSDGVRHFDDWDFMRFVSCALPMVVQGVDACGYKGFQFQSCYSGLSSGGWWLQRAANSYGYMPLGAADIFAIGWTDACKIEKIEYFNDSAAADVARFKLVDEFFDTYFWKSQNNTTRLSTTTDGTTPNAGSIIKYTGVAGRYLFESPRQKRNGHSNDIGIAKVYGSPKTPHFCYAQWKILSGYAEKVGLLDRSASAAGTDANNYYKSPYNTYLSIDYLPSILIEQEPTTLATQNSTVLNSTRANSPIATAVADSNGTPKGFLQVDGGVRIGNNGRVLDETQRYEQYDFWNGTGQTIIRQTTPKHMFSRGGITWRSTTLTNLANNGEILLKEEAYPSTVVNPDNRIRGYIGTEETPFETEGYMSWCRTRNQVECYIDLLVTETMRSNAILRVYLHDYAKNPPMVSTEQSFGVRVPQLEVIRLPTLTNASIEPKAVQIGTSASNKTSLSFFGSFDVATELKGDCYSADGWLRIKVTYRCEKWD